MYKLLIVDDEFLVIEGLKNLVDWKKYNIHIIAEASNANDGISLALDRKPDIIITDIKMPDMTGLDMIKRILDINPETRFIILSGYDNFNWAKRAFQYGAADYLLKPVNLQQLDDVLKKVVNKIEESDTTKKTKSDLEKTLSKGLSLIKKEVLTELFNGEYKSLETLEEKLHIAKITIKEEPHVVILLMTGKNDRIEDEDNSFMMDKAGDIISSIEHDNLGYGLVLAENKLALLIRIPEDSNLWCRIIAENISHRFHLQEKNVIIGIGGICNRLNRIKHSFIEAELALQYQYLIQDTIIFYNDVQSRIKRFEKLEYPVHLENLIIEGLKLFDTEKVSKSLDSFFKLIQEKVIEIGLYKNIMIELLLSVKRNLGSVNINLSNIFTDEYEEIYKLNKMGSLNEISDAVKYFINKIISYIEISANKNNKQIVQEILRYIDNHYATDSISLSEVAERVYLTPNYVSALIKQEAGENFYYILTRKRIEKAKELLMDETLKSYEIAEKVGYQDTNYFIRAFKKVIGMTPTEYRNKFCS